MTSWTTATALYIKEYGLVKFMKLKGRAQNDLLNKHFNAQTDKEKSSVKSQKAKFYKFLRLQNETSVTNGSPKTKPPPQTKTPLITPPDDALPHSQGGGLQKLTEEIFEDALVRVLYEDPTKALAPALAFLDKKKSLSVEDTDTNISQIALDKLEQKRKAMFT